MQRNLYLCLLADISPEEDISPKNKLRNTFFSKCVTTLFTRAIVTQLFRLDVLYVRWCWCCNSIRQNIWTSKNLVRPRNIPSNQLRNRELCWKQKIKPLLGCGFVLMISVSRLDKAWKWGHIFIEIYKDCIDIHTFLVLQEKKMEKDKTWNVDFSGEQTLPAHINASNRSGVNVSTLTPPPPSKNCRTVWIFWLSTKTKYLHAIPQQDYCQTAHSFMMIIAVDMKLGGNTFHNQ